MIAPLLLLKVGGITCLLAAMLLLMWLAIGVPDAPVLRLARRYIEALDRRMRRLFLAPSGRLILAAQSAAVFVALGAGLFAGEARPLWLVPVIAAAPIVVLARMTHLRKERLEAQVDTFALSLANALRATPNIARALQTVAYNISSPLRQELELTLRELRVGSTLDQALADLGARLDCMPFDAALCALTIGRRVGGNVPKILSETAATLREMARLQATLRAKTADGRTQSVVLGAAPVAVVIAFDYLKPGYFAPLTETAIGYLVLVVAGACWIAAVIGARRILMVEM